MSKIIGFTISKNKISHSDIDVFNVGLSKLEYSKNGFNIYLWGIGDLKEFENKYKISLSFPKNESLLDRNVLINFENNKITIENDWLASIPVFYNKKDLIVSTLSLKCLTDKTIDQEGLQNFMEFGYSVFEHTMFSSVKFLRFYSKLAISDFKFEIEYKKDPIIEEFGKNNIVDEEEVISEIDLYLSDIENNTKGKIIIPTSGGYDSRLLNYFVKDKSRVRSFTYGGSKNQAKSKEVYYAEKLSEILNTKWQHIKLDDYFKYFNDWFKTFGFSTHLHGMYHIDFFKKIRKSEKFDKSVFLLSGIVGDAWAGKNYKFEINTHKDIYKLGLSHGVNLNLKYSKLNVDENIKKDFFKNNKNEIQNSGLQTITFIRIKMILLSYLMQLPEYFGFISYTPFLNFNIVTKMFKISGKRRENRKWQTDFFVKNNIDLNSMNLNGTNSNTLDIDTFKISKFELIETENLEKYIDKKQLQKINSKIKKISFIDNFKNMLLTTPKIKGVCQLLGIKSNTRQAIFEYYIIKAIEKSIKE
ncbi:MAG: hypothetical protein JXR51_06400 [Bacteroidales bacterium]|nr:hypothetical protein [Bacteroidales bacterium]MBN2756792.1 hypothetical protein [Bacteroidales bacterium]